MIYTHSGYLIAETSQALLIGAEPLRHCDDSIWIPKSKIISEVCERVTEGLANCEPITVEIPDWLAEAKGLA